MDGPGVAIEGLLQGEPVVDSPGRDGRRGGEDGKRSERSSTDAAGNTKAGDL
jgi:hypothetical protein